MEWLGVKLEQSLVKIKQMFPTSSKKKFLTNFKVIQKVDSRGQTYFIIFDNSEPENKKNAYFCWTESIKIGKEDLKNNWQNWKEIEIEYQEGEKGNRVINIWSDTDNENFLI